MMETYRLNDGKSYCNQTKTMIVEIMDIPYLHGEDIWTEYRIPNIDRISYVYPGFVS